MKYKSHCRCGWPYQPDNRHVGEMGQMEDCKPSDNLEYLEMVSERRDNLNKLKKKENE